MKESFTGLKGNWTLFTEENSPLPVNYVLAPFTAVDQNRIWMNVWISRGLGVPAKEYGLFVTDGVEWSEFKFGEHGLPTFATEYMATDSHNQLWLSVPYVGICSFDGQSTILHEFGGNGPSKPMFVTDLHVDESDQVWIATLGHGAYRFFDERWKKVASDLGAFSDYIKTFGMDCKNHLWLACEDKKETRFLSNRSGSWDEVCSFPIGLKHEDEVSCFVVDSDDRIWVGWMRKGLMVWDNQGWEQLTERDCPLLYGEIQDIKIDEFSNLWVGTAGGFAIFDSDRWHNWGAVCPGSAEQPVSRECLLSTDAKTRSQYTFIGGFVAIDGTGRKWLNSSKGLVMFAPRKCQIEKASSVS